MSRPDKAASTIRIPGSVLHWSLGLSPAFPTLFLPPPALTGTAYQSDQVRLASSPGPKAVADQPLAGTTDGHSAPFLPKSGLASSPVGW